MTVSVSLDSLPEDLLVVEVCSRVAASSLSDIQTLQSVSKSFLRLCNDPYILQRFPLHKFPLFPWFRNLEKFSNFLKKCRKNGNPEAIYRKGLVNYFHRNSDEQRRERGLKHIAKAAEKGNEAARYVYGLILICLGGKSKKMGFQILSSLKKPLMSSTIQEMEKHRIKIRDEMWWFGKMMMIHLKRSYVRENCNCDCRTNLFFLKNCVWDCYGESNDMTTSSICNICLCHHEVKLFFDN